MSLTETGNEAISERWITRRKYLRKHIWTH